MKLALILAMACGCAYTQPPPQFAEPVGASRRPFGQIPPTLAVRVSGQLPPAEQLEQARELAQVIATRLAALKDDPDEPRQLIADLQLLDELLPPRPDLQRICDRMIDAARQLAEATSTNEREVLREAMQAGLALLRLRLGGGYTVAGGYSG